MEAAPTKIDSGNDWQPTATIANLRRRSEILAKIRQFFAERSVIEVETPLLSQHTVTNPYIQSFSTLHQPNISHQQVYYLQTSPEYAMKRLLAAGSGSIYQLAKSFRNEEISDRHNPEFSLLEWYRVNFDHFQLMDEVKDFLIFLLGERQVNKLTYEELFKQHLQINPHHANLSELKNCSSEHKINIADADSFDRDTWLDILMTHIIEPKLNPQHLNFVYHFPASQAALAKINYDQNGNAIAERFEVYAGGMELANGFHELTDAKEQQQRFESENQQRAKNKQPQLAIDFRFLKALEKGLPPCAGVALGVDRLMMIALNAKSINEVLSLSFVNA